MILVRRPRHPRLQLPPQPRRNRNHRAQVNQPGRATKEMEAAMEIPGVGELLREVKTFVDFARGCRAGEPVSIPLTREEVDVVASYRRFVAELEVE